MLGTGNFQRFQKVYLGPFFVCGLLQRQLALEPVEVGLMPVQIFAPGLPPLPVAHKGKMRVLY